MSHDRKPPRIPPPSSTSPEEYGSALAATDPPYPFPTTGYYQHSPATKAAAAAAAADGSATMGDGRQLSPVERWAARASDSQFNAIAGAIGGFTSGVVTCPLDVIKTKLQAQGGFVPIQKGRHAGHHKVYEGLIGTSRVIWREEGIRGMYRGLGPIILGYLPTWAVWFTVYNRSKEYLGQYHENSFVINFWSSIIAGASSTIATNPIWVIKTRLMSQTSLHSRAAFSVFPKGSNTPTSRPTLHTPWHYTSTLDAARKMYTTEGVMSFYSGLAPALLGLTHVAVQFPAYEWLRTQFTGQGMGHSAEGDGKAHWLGILSASILSKILASSATYPHEVIRTRLQTQRRPAPGQEYLEGFGIVAEDGPKTGSGSGNGSSSSSTKSNGESKSKSKGTVLPPKYKGVVRTFRTILAEEGWRAFYAGMGTNMMRAVPAATVTMVTYEYVMKQLNTTKSEARQKMHRL